MKKLIGKFHGMDVYSDPSIPPHTIYVVPKNLEDYDELLSYRHKPLPIEPAKWYESYWFDRTMVFLLFLALCAMIVFLAAIWNNGSYL